METLTWQDVEKLFSGAPQYFSRSEGHFTGAPHPSVAFPYDESLEIRDLTDHTQIEDEAWRCLTAWPHIIRDQRIRRRPSSRPRPHFVLRCRERPNMLSMSGLEKGSMGYQAALELAVSDALQEEQFGFDTLSAKPPAVVEARQRMLNSKADLRRLSERDILEQLIRAGERYCLETFKTPGFSDTLYEELFLKMLHPRIRPIDRHDPFSLQVQIQALVRVLAAGNVWIDFSHVDWRVRLGQLLWGARNDDGVQDGEIDETETEGDHIEERYWLLLQILLSCELLIRLDAITEGEESGVETIKPYEVSYFERNANLSVKWSLLLARAWLDNILVTRLDGSAERTGYRTIRPATTSWLASLTSKLSLSRGVHAADGLATGNPVYEIRGRHGERQVDGLTHFARKLRWPGIDEYEARISKAARVMANETHKKCSAAPPSLETKRLSPFEAPDGKRAPSRRRHISAALHPAGWISKSYISGLMLPGESISHFLMATLLENDSEAMKRLGSMASLCGGFKYSGKSFWSTQCIVGRVLAAGKGSVECMGWISSDILPDGVDDGWMDIESHEAPDDVKQTLRKARIWDKKNLEADSRVLGDVNIDDVLPADFIIAFENTYKTIPPKKMTINLQALTLFSPAATPKEMSAGEKLKASSFNDSHQLRETRTYLASMSFWVTTDQSAWKELTFSLSNDINFVTAHPCVPSHHVKIMKSVSSPTIQQIDTCGSLTGGSSNRRASSATITGHPLHKSYTYTTIHLNELLGRRAESLDGLLNETAVGRPSLTPSQDRAPRILVIDCITGFQPQPQMHEIPASPVLSRKDCSSFPLPPRNFDAQDGAEYKMHTESRKRQFGSDMEMLVRALCAERGWNALVSRRRRGCLGCAIREASALAWKVIVRVD